MSYLDSVIAHKFQKEQLLKQFSSDTLPHALLFSGNAGIGKRLLAVRLAQDILLSGCNSPIERENVSKLLNCGNHPDLLFVEPEKDKKIISVDAVRKLIASLQLKPFMATKIVAIINNAHLMNSEANNALLKTLEEPLPAAILILITDRPHRLLETVISRCQTYNFSPMTRGEVRDVLGNLSNNLSSGIEKSTIESLMKISDDSLELLKLHQFIDQRTDKIIDHAGLKEHIEHLSTLAVDITNDLNKLLVDAPNHNFAVSLAAKISENKSTLYLGTFMHLLRKKLQSQMLETVDDKSAEALDATVTAEQLILESNANMQLQLADLFLSF